MRYLLSLQDRKPLVALPPMPEELKAKIHETSTQKVDQSSEDAQAEIRKAGLMRSYDGV